MTKKERYMRSEFLLESVSKTLNLMKQKKITCHKAIEFNEPIQQLIEAKILMATAEYNILVKK